MSIRQSWLFIMDNSYTILKMCYMILTFILVYQFKIGIK